jgi:uncharacterized protein YegL
MEQQMEALKRDSKALTQRLSDPWKMRVIAFNSTVSQISPWTHDSTVHCAAIDKLVADGGTQMYGALRQDAQDLTLGSAKRTTILFTDGRDSTGSTNIEQTLARYREHNTTVHVVALDQTGIDEPVLRRIAEYTGGSFQKLTKIEQLNSSFAALAAAMQTKAYRLTSLSPIDQSTLSITVGRLAPSRMDVSTGSTAVVARWMSNR